MIDLQYYVREAARDAFCRVCDGKIEKGELMFSFYSHRNRGQNIHICKSCIDSIKDVDMEVSGYD